MLLITSIDIHPAINYHKNGEKKYESSLFPEGPGVHIGYVVVYEYKK